MEMDFEPNSHKYKMDKIAKDATESAEPEEKKFEKVVTGNVKTRKRGLGKRFVDIFLTEDVGDVKTYIIYDVMIPAIKENVADMINAAIGMLFFGEASRRPRKGSGAVTGSKINYGGYFAGNERRERLPSYTRSSIAHNYDDLVFDNRGEAELVLDCMLDAVQTYGRVSVADLYDFAGISSSKFTDVKYGWTNLQGARVSGSATRGYFIDLPKCTALD